MERDKPNHQSSSDSQKGWEPQISDFDLKDRLSASTRQVLREIENSRRNREAQTGKPRRTVFNKNRKG